MKKILGDSKLARKIGMISPSYSEDLRTKIHTIVESRVKELGEASLTLLVNEDLAVASSISTS